MDAVCPCCGKDLGGCLGEVWDAVQNIETRFYECENGHKISVMETYKPTGEDPIIYEGWDMKGDDSLEYGKFYIGCLNGEGKLMCYSWDYDSWRMAEVGNPINNYITYTKMSVKVANDTMKEINEQYPEVQLFLIPQSDAKRWGINN